MICPKCNTGTLIEGHATLPATVKEVQVSVFISAFSCNHCEYKTVHSSQMVEYMRMAADEYRKAYGLLTSIQIRSAREGVGMSQDKFAEYLGVGVASVKRWELGQVQDRAMDKLLRLMTNVSTAQANFLHLRDGGHQPKQGYSSGGKQWKRASAPYPALASNADKVA